MKIMRILAVLCALALIATAFLPYFDLTEEGKESAAFLTVAEEELSKGDDTIIEAMQDGSLSSVDLYRWVYVDTAEKEPEDLTVMAILMCGLLAIPVLILLMSLIGCATPVLLFTAGLYVYEQKFIRKFWTEYFSEYWVVPGMAQKVYPILCAVMAVIAVAMFAAKRSRKKKAA